MKTFELSKEIIQEIGNLISDKKNKEIKKSSSENDNTMIESTF